MFVIVSTFQVKHGEEDALIALHEDWLRHQQSKARGFLSGELLRNIEASGEFVGIMRFVDREAAHAQASDPEQKAWYRRVVSLTEVQPTCHSYVSEWQAP